MVAIVVINDESQITNEITEVQWTFHFWIKYTKGHLWEDDWISE